MDLNPKPVFEGREATQGQSLVEFVLVMPLLVLMLVGGYSLGLGTYTAHMTSGAMQVPSMEKLKLSNETAQVGTGTLQGYMNASGLKGNFDTGSLVDSVTTQDVDQYTTIMVGSKNYESVASFVPGFTINVGQAINKNLLQAANSGAQVRPYNTPWVPGGTPNPPPAAGAAAAPAAAPAPAPAP